MEDNFMHKIEIEIYEIECADGLFKLAENNDDIDIIKGYFLILWILKSDSVMLEPVPISSKPSNKSS